MSNLPRILMIDDEYGHASGGRNRSREDLCARLSLQDVTGDVRAEPIRQPLAEAVFCRGQREYDGIVENDPAGVLAVVKGGWEKRPRWAMVLVDLHFKTGRIGSDGEPSGRDKDRDPDRYFGLTILEQIDCDPALRDLPVAILSAMDRERVESRFTDRGALAFTDKSTLDRGRLEEILWTFGLLEDDILIGHSVPFLLALRDARRQTRISNGNILIVGEPGTGKELLAKYIHRVAIRLGRRDVYVPVFTQGVPETLLDDRLFGHARGAFQGAGADVPGPAEEADGGTLFIDEFGCISGEAQKKLLRLLDRNIRETQRVGTQNRRIVDVLVVLASNHPDMLRSADFRSGILSRAGAGLPIYLPPLRERREDIPTLAEHFVQKYEANSRSMSPEAMALLSSHDWPENVRELEDSIERAIKTFPGLRYLSARHLRLGSGRAGPTSTVQEVAFAPSSALSHMADVRAPVAEFDRILASVDAFVANAMSHAEWAGKLPAVLDAFGRMMATLVLASIKATRKPTPDNAQGKLEITPAMKLLSGRADLRTPSAADLIKKLRGISPATSRLWDADPVLREAFEASVRARPYKATPDRNDAGKRDGL